MAGSFSLYYYREKVTEGGTDLTQDVLELTLWPYVGYFLWHGLEAGLYIPMTLTRTDYWTRLEIAFMAAVAYNLHLAAERIFLWTEARVGGGHGRWPLSDNAGGIEKTAGPIFLVKGAVGLKVALGRAMLRFALVPGYKRQKYDGTVRTEAGMGVELGFGGYFR